MARYTTFIFVLLVFVTGCSELFDSCDDCCYSVPLMCENNAVVTRDENKMVIMACEPDEQCIAFTEDWADCRLQERCADPPAPPECRGDDLIYCDTIHSVGTEHFLARSHCRDRYGDKLGRCEPNTTAGARCVDLDAVACTADACDGDDKLVCLDGFTDRQAACTFESDRTAGGTCRINHEDKPVCAQADTPRCDPVGYGSHCEGTQIVSCRDGFIWRHDCPAGTACHIRQYGKTNPTYLPVCE